MKKRILSVLLAALICVSLLSACGSDDTSDQETNQTGASSSISGIVYDVPEDWTENDSKADAFKSLPNLVDASGYTFGENGVAILVSVELSGNDDRQASSIASDMKEAMLKGKNIEVKDETTMDMKIANQQATRISFVIGLGEVEEYYEIVVITSGKTAYAMIVGSDIDQKTETVASLNKLLDSIKTI